MAWKLGQFQIAPGQKLRHGYWWNGPPKGPQIAVASPITAIVTGSNGVNTVGNGFHLNGGCNYWVDVVGEDVHGTGGFGVYDIWVGSLFGLPSS